MDCSLDSLDVSAKTPIFESTGISSSQVLSVPQQAWTEPAAPKHPPWALEGNKDMLEHTMSIPDGIEHGVDMDNDFFEQDFISAADLSEAGGIPPAQLLLPTVTKPTPNHREDIKQRKLVACSPSSLLAVTHQDSVADNENIPPCLSPQASTISPSHNIFLHSPKVSDSDESSERHTLCPSVHRSDLSANSPVLDSSLSPSYKPSPVVRSRIDPRSQSFEEIRIPELSLLHIDDTGPSKPSNDKRKNNKELSAWEKWMLNKTREALARQQALKKQKLSRQQQEIESSEAAAKRKAKSELVHKQWVREKDAKEKARRETECAKIAAKKKMEEERKQASLAKAAACYEEWCKKTEKEQRQLKMKQREQAKKNEVKAQETRRKSDHAYKVWFETVGCKKLDSNLLRSGT